ncbi:hypothetical protein KC19_10G061600 [Ceratodon purpureus]|uniref:Deoxynucleoside kinase domain-containing protein n=1 Tax=Ceratodon purpureus TaxID=3225 RepID=A0A8T0GHP9_CERPU|nr:hypothetical protein KC19_10G061600 [Ceratodon purpureus]
MEALARKFPASWFSSLNLMAVPLKRYMETASSKTQLPSGEPQLLSAPVADAQTQVHDEAAFQQPEDEVDTIEQYLEHFPTKKTRAGIIDREGNESENFLLKASKPARISFEGNIGVGKSTILKLLHSHPRLKQVTEILQEPIWEWQNVKGTGLNMLEAFYKNPQRYAYLFQSFVFTTRFLQQNAAASQSKAALLLMERSVLTDRCVFVKTAREQGYFNTLEVAAYDAWYNGVITTLPNVVPDAFVYLRADPNVCYERLKARARSEEAEVSLEYLQSLHSKHEKWFIESAFDDAGNWGGKSQAGHFSSSSKVPAVIRGRPIFVVDCSKTLEFDKPSKEVDRVIEEIVGFLLAPPSESLCKFT